MSFILEIPYPQTFLEVLWASIGFMFGRAFGKKLDYTIQQTPWFMSQDKVVQWFLECVLNFFHHFWMGGLLMIYFPQPEIYWFGYGLFVDDLPDVPRRFKKLFSVG